MFPDRAVGNSARSSDDAMDLRWRRRSSEDSLELGPFRRALQPRSNQQEKKSQKPEYLTWAGYKDATEVSMLKNNQFKK